MIRWYHAQPHPIIVYYQLFTFWTHLTALVARSQHQFSWFFDVTWLPSSTNAGQDMKRGKITFVSRNFSFLCKIFQWSSYAQFKSHTETLVFKNPIWRLSEPATVTLLWSKRSCGFEWNICLILTTGTPKGAILTHANLVADISAYRVNMRQVRICAGV